MPSLNRTDIPKLPHFGFLNRESRYALTGPQVAPEAANWAQQTKLHVLRQADIHDLAQAVPHYPDPTPVVTGEIDFLNHLAQNGQRDQLLLANEAVIQQRWNSLAAAHGIPGANRPIRTLSFFLREPLVPWQTPDAVLSDRDPTASPPRRHVVNTGRGLARYFQDETPGLAHRLAVNYLLQQLRSAGRAPSPPAQAVLWAALDTAIASALLAAWYVKWVYDPTAGHLSRHARRPRPVEKPFIFDFDRPQHPLTGVLYDATPPVGTSGLCSPGTPRHPAYPSGHSTYSAAASTVLAGFFPEHAEDFADLADNIGMARLWGGVHWPSDHTAGRALGEAVGNEILHQLDPADSSGLQGIQLDHTPPATSPPPS